MKKTVSSIALFLIFATTGGFASDTLAKVNGSTIDRDDADAYIKSTQPILNYEMIDARDKKDVLDRLIERELLIEAAKKDNIEKSEAFQEELKRAKEELMIKIWLQKSFEETIVSDSEAREYYKKNNDEFMEPQMIHARHILLQDEKSAKEIIEELKKFKGEDLEKKFIEMARKNSIAPTAANGGDLGFFGRKQMLKPFEKAVFSMKDGEITSAPVHTQYGWHVIYVKERRAPGKISFEKVKERIMRELKKENFAKRMAKEVDVMKKAAEIEILDPEVNSLKADGNDTDAAVEKKNN